MKPRQQGDFHLDLDPRIDLTQPIFKQREAIDEASRGPSPFGSVEGAAQIMRWLKDSLEYMKRIRQSPNFGSMRLELEDNGVRVWYRRNELKRSNAVSWKALEHSHINLITNAINEVIRSVDFNQSPAGRNAKKHLP